MKVLFETDPHFKELGSMSNESRFNGKYSTRLDLMIKSFEWFYQQARSNNVDVIVHGGDILDKPVILAKESHALEESFSYNTTNIPEYVMVGNHDRKDDDTHALAVISNYPSVTIVNKPLNLGDISFLPFTSDVNYDIFDELRSKVLFSHVDMIGTKYGQVVSSKGFDPAILGNYFNIILNGHIHTPSILGKVVNTGSFMGGSLGDEYNDRYPSAYLLDTDTLELTYIVNPYSMHYETINSNNLLTIKQSIDKLVDLNYYTYLRIQCPNSMKTEVRLMVDSYMSKYPRILSSIVVSSDRLSSTVSDTKVTSDTLHTVTDPVEILLGFIRSVADDKLPTNRRDLESMISSDYTAGETYE